MKRRHLLQAMLTVPVVSALGGCRHEHRDKHNFPPARGGTLRVMLQGPFALVLDTTNKNKITAYVPFTGPDDKKSHEFRFLDPSKPLSDEGGPGKRNQYKFTLPGNHLEINDRLPIIDSGFQDVTLNVKGWIATPEDYFVSIELPAPDYITYIPPAIPVVMKDTDEPRLAITPTNHILEYRIREFEDWDKIVLKPKSAQHPDGKPVHCQDLHSGFQEHWNLMEKNGEHDRQRAHMELALKRYSETPCVMFFLGVGVSPNTDDDSKKVHALSFFNNKLLGGFKDAPEHDGMILKDVDVKPCSSGTGTVNHGAMLTSAVYRYPVPRLRPVSASAFYFTAADDCRAGVVNAIVR
jgi:hypothetical protein